MTPAAKKLTTQNTRLLRACISVLKKIHEGKNFRQEELQALVMRISEIFARRLRDQLAQLAKLEKDGVPGPLAVKLVIARSRVAAGENPAKKIAAKNRKGSKRN